MHILSESEWSDEQKKLKTEYETKVKNLADERAKHKKGLEAELKKVDMNSNINNQKNYKQWLEIHSNKLCDIMIYADIMIYNDIYTDIMKYNVMY